MLTNCGNLGGFSPDTHGWATGANSVTHLLLGGLAGTGPVTLVEAVEGAVK